MARTMKKCGRPVNKQWLLPVCCAVVCVLLFLIGLSTLVITAPHDRTGAPTLPPSTKAPTSTTNAPTSAPTVSKAPTSAPTRSKPPTGAPTISKVPTSAPTSTTGAPTISKAPTSAPTSTNAPTGVPTASTGVPTAITGVPTAATSAPTAITNAPTASSAPTPPTITNAPTSAPTLLVSACRCGLDEQPLYNTFPHPAHTEASYAVFNFYNHNGIDDLGNNLTVYITVQVTADAAMQIASGGVFLEAYTYIYLDAFPLHRGQLFTLTIPYNITAAGRLGGGRIVVYYEDPETFDDLRNEPRYGGDYPVVVSPATIVPITTADGNKTIPSSRFQQAMEFTLDVLQGTDPFTRSFIDYDITTVDRLSVPVYIFGGYDLSTLANATTGNNNNGFPCGKAYIACHTPNETLEGCPTRIVDRTFNGGACESSFVYCQTPREQVENPEVWDVYCHVFDTVAAGFGITQERLDFYRLCNTRLANQTIPGCPPFGILMPDLRTPTAVIYGCDGISLLENHCLLNGARYANSTLDGSQCSALNRGLCVTPNFTHVPLPSGLSCAQFTCPGSPGDATCLIPCFDYSCFGFLCANYSALPSFPATCAGITCPVANGNTNCIDYDKPVSKSKESQCNDSAPDPYIQNRTQNEYAAWGHTKGERFYTFSLDEEVGGGNQQCLFSTQLDIVIYPSCSGNFPG